MAEEGDELSRSIFYDAGKMLARHVIGLLPQIDPVSGYFELVTLYS